MTAFQRIAFLFPGQGAQYVGMGNDFFAQFSAARHIFEEADDLLQRSLSTLSFEGPVKKLTETQNSQLAIYVMSMAVLAVVQQEIGPLQPHVCAGLSLGEYSALTAAGYLPFPEGLSLVEKRAQFMNEACEKKQGTMAVVMGLDAETVERLVEKIEMPDDLWAANFNCPGQVVLSGTPKGIERASVVAKEQGAKRVVLLQVHGAFHSGLMQFAQEQLAPFLQKASLQEGKAALVMNASGDYVSDREEIRKQLEKQVTQPVRWEQGVRAMMRDGVDLYVEMGCGKTLAGMNKRIGVEAPTLSLDRVSDLNILQQTLEGKGDAVS